MKPLSLYLHLPFCVRKCRYCDFLSYPASPEEMENYVSLLCKEVRTWGKACADKTVDSVFFGGGTPSLLTGDLFAKLMQQIYESFRVESSAEITMEANPGTLTYENITRYRQEGVNRLSLGAQSFSDKELALLGRIHKAVEIEESFALARSVGFRNINLDLMSALPGQTKEDCLYSVRKAVELSPEHISVYSLILEEGTELGDAYLGGSYGKNGWPDLPDEDIERDMVHETADCLRAAGYEQYEISNFAKPGFASCHNIGYWTGHDYLGLGVGAASKLGNVRFSNPKEGTTCSEEAWFRFREESAPQGCFGPAFGDQNTPGVVVPLSLIPSPQILTKQEEMEEFCFLGLRMTKGISEAEFKQRFDRDFTEVYGEAFRKNAEAGLLAREGDRVFLTERGLDLANRVMADFLLDETEA